MYVRTSGETFESRLVHSVALTVVALKNFVLLLKILLLVPTGNNKQI